MDRPIALLKEKHINYSSCMIPSVAYTKVLHMGKVRIEAIKRVSRNLYSRYPEYFSSDFQANKEKLKTILPTSSKGVRNRVAGYVTRVVRVKMKEGQIEEAAEEEDVPEETE